MCTQTREITQDIGDVIIGVNCLFLRPLGLDKLMQFGTKHHCVTTLKSMTFLLCGLI